MAVQSVDGGQVVQRQRAEHVVEGLDRAELHQVIDEHISDIAIIHEDGEHFGQALEGERLDGAALDVNVRQHRAVRHDERIELIVIMYAINTDCLYRLVVTEIQVGDTRRARKRD